MAAYEDEEDDLEGESEYNDNPRLPEGSQRAAKEWGKTAAKFWSDHNEDGTKRTHILARKTSFVSALIHLDGHPFSFKGREYLEPIYDRNDAEVLMKNARQTEKTCRISSPILMSNGCIRRAEDIVVGDFLSTLNISTQKIVSGKVIWKSRIYTKPCLRIKTRQGHDIEVAGTHPVRMWEEWAEASKIKVGDKVACVRKAGRFGNVKKTDEQIELTAFMIADGYCPQHLDMSFTQNPGPVLKRFLECAEVETVSYRKIKRAYGDSYDVRFSAPNFLEELVGRNSYTHEIPEWVFGLSKEKTALFLNRLWSCDGHLKRRSPTLYDFVYASMSKKLVRQVQSLLWKFGIPSAIRENLPSIYKKRGETDKVAHLLRVETAAGVDTFLREIGALGKSEGMVYPDLSNCNNNRYTFPKGMSEIISKIYESDGVVDKRGTSARSLAHYGLRKKPEYALSQDKARRYLEFFESDGSYSKASVQELRNHLDSDIYWDVVESIEEIGGQECVDFEVENHHNFIIDGIITHNSTYLSNDLVIRSLVHPFNKSLYVSPSHMQTRQFSSEKLKPILDNSPLIAKYFQDSAVSQQVFEKGFCNGSFIFLRSAFRSADRTRGISSRNLYLDELQDFLLDQIPVIRECTSHFPDAVNIYSGTPKSLNNPIEIYWKGTTQNEWLVPCSHCGKWNFLDEKNIGPTQAYIDDTLPPGPICRYCAKPIDIKCGKWVSMCPGKPMKGYRVPQLMVPWICGLKNQWMKLLWKRDNYPMSQFYNEVLGLSFDNASSPITMQELIDICGDYEMWDLDRLTSDQVNRARGMLLTGGVDWGEGLDGSEKSPSGKPRPASYTVFTLGYYHNQNQFKVVAIKKFTGKEVDPDYVVSYVSKTCKNLGIQLLAVDWGHGWGVNNTLVRLLGPQHVVQVQHLTKLKQKMKWDPIGVRYHVHRNFMMSELFFDMKHGFITFPKWAHFEPFSKDILSIYTEYNEQRREMKYDHRNAEPDDAFHSILYCKLASDIMTGKSRKYTQNISED